MKATVDAVAGGHCEACGVLLEGDAPCARCTPPPGGATDPLIGRRLGGYELRSVLGRGAMGVVYLAFQRSLEREVAVKILPTIHAGDDRRVARFFAEADAMSRVGHPNVVTVLDVGQADELLWIAMERLPGCPLSTLIETGPQPPSRVARIGAQMCDALDAAHRAGVVHRDLKPENIFLTSRDPDFVKLLDFGVARTDDDGRLTAPGAVMGTPAYMSPEQARGEPATISSDLYAVGVVLYELLSGRRPFGGASHAVLVAHVSQRPPALAVAAVLPALGALVMSALEKDPVDRPPTARAFRELLLATVAGTSESLATASRPVRDPRSQQWMRAVLALAAVVAAAWFGFGRREPVVEGPPASAASDSKPATIEPAPSAPPAPGSPTLLAGFPAFTGRELLEGSLQKLGASTLRQVFLTSLETATDRLGTWELERVDAPQELTELVQLAPLPGGRNDVELRLQFSGSSLGRVYVRLYERDPQLEQDLAGAFGPGEAVLDYDQCPGILWRGVGGSVDVLARNFTNTKGRSWRGIVFAPGESWDEMRSLLGRMERVAKETAMADAALDASPARTAEAVAQLMPLVAEESSAFGARTELCRARYDLGELPAARAECERVLSATPSAGPRRKATYFRALIDAAGGEALAARQRLEGLRAELRGLRKGEPEWDLLPHVEQRLAGLNGPRGVAVIQTALCRRRAFRGRGVFARAAVIAREFGFADDAALTAEARQAALVEEGCP